MFYQSLKSSNVLYVPTVNETRKHSVNLLHSTQPISSLHRVYINEAQKHQLACGLRKTEVYEPIPAKKQILIDLDNDNAESPLHFSGGKKVKVRFDSKNPDDAQP
jgi:hypothetical protein